MILNKQFTDEMPIILYILIPLYVMTYLNSRKTFRYKNIVGVGILHSKWPIILRITNNNWKRHVS